MNGILPLAPDGVTRTYMELARFEHLTSPWHWAMLLLAACAGLAALAITVAIYWRDGEELPAGVRPLLLLLRIAALIGLVVFFMEPMKIGEREISKNSRVVVLVDTSQSMGLRDASSTTTQAAPSRLQKIMEEFSQGELLPDLLQRHDVQVLAFDNSAAPREIAFFPRPAVAAPVRPKQQVAENAVSKLRRAMFIAAGFWAAGILLGGVYAVSKLRRRALASWFLFGALASVLTGFVVLGVGHLIGSEAPLAAAFYLNAGEQTPPDENASPPEKASEEKASDGGDADQKPANPGGFAWEESLAPSGPQTMIADALSAIIQKERGGPIAGIALLTDGQQNAGVHMGAAEHLARNAGIPIYTIGMGVAERPANVRIVDVEAPRRVYPGDNFTITAYLQTHGFGGRNVKVELFGADVRPNADEDFEEEQAIPLGSDGEIIAVRFQVKPVAAGKRVYRVHVAAPSNDHDPQDNNRSATVRVVERGTQVLLFAGGPMREYRFLRNQLYRDRDVTLHVLLQTAQPGASQEADELLYSFPATAEELFAYDCIVAFDPDWRTLDDLQVELLERWVAEKAGGLILVSGPVYTPRWTSRGRGDSRIEKIKSMYPVSFYRRNSPTLRLGRHGSEKPWPLKFTREGLEAEFLQLGESNVESEQAWDEFAGVYGFAAVRGAKPGAQVYARFSDPDAVIGGEAPVYFASQFYGSGRTLFMASGELWRIRELDEKYFEQFYVKLIRWASQGRLMRDSNRGVLLVDKDRCLLGDRIVVRAQLTDPQFRPLTEKQVTAQLINPDGARTEVVLKSVQGEAGEGFYEGQFTALQAGEARLELPVPQSREAEVLSREVTVRVPDLELEHPERNDPLLKHLAEISGGAYFVGLDAAMNRGGLGTAPLASLIRSQDQHTYLPGIVDKRFSGLLAQWLLALLCGVLFTEWLVRRLHKLA